MNKYLTNTDKVRLFLKLVTALFCLQVFNPAHSAVIVPVVILDAIAPAGVGSTGQGDVLTITNNTGEKISTLTVTLLDLAPNTEGYMFFDTVELDNAGNTVQNGYAAPGQNSPGFDGSAGFLNQSAVNNTGFLGGFISAYNNGQPALAMGDGADQIVLTFNDFDINEIFSFSIDIDGWNGSGVNKINNPLLGILVESTPTLVPLPGAFWMFSLGLVGIYYRVRRQRSDLASCLSVNCQWDAGSGLVSCLSVNC